MSSDHNNYEVHVMAEGFVLTDLQRIALSTEGLRVADERTDAPVVIENVSASSEGHAKLRVADFLDVDLDLLVAWRVSR